MTSTTKRKRGHQPISTEPLAKIELWVPASMKAGIQAEAAKESSRQCREVTVSELIRDLIEKFLQRHP